MHVLLFMHGETVEVFANEVALAEHLKGFKKRDAVAELVALARQHPDEKVRTTDGYNIFIKSTRVIGA